MKRIDASPTGIFDITWSADGKWLAYVSGDDEVRIANVETGEIRIIGPGRSPYISDDQKVVLERDGEIVLVSGSGSKTLLTKKDVVCCANTFISCENKPLKNKSCCYIGALSPYPQRAKIRALPFF